jgi:hypothetical protein
MKTDCQIFWERAGILCDGDRHLKSRDMEAFVLTLYRAALSYEEQNDLKNTDEDMKAIRRHIRSMCNLDFHMNPIATKRACDSVVSLIATRNKERLKETA